jgi:hypothetical protein
VLRVLLAIALAIPSCGSTLAVPAAGSMPSPAVSGPADGTSGRVVTTARRVADRTDGRSADLDPVVDWSRGPNPAAVRSAAARVAASRDTPAPVAIAETREPAAAAYRGTNHLWIPSLGINRPVASFPCSRTTPPGNHVYRWGCAGRNNVYLLGHAYSVFKPLHDAYASGRLRKGMEAIYADGNGRVTRYVVAWWKVTPPDGDVGWAYAAQSSPSMTLQTCVGADSAHRLVVRLVRKG